MDTREKQTPPFFEHFAGLPDPRTRRADYPLQELLLVAVCAILCGADTWVDVAAFGEAKLTWLRRVLPVPAPDANGNVPSPLAAVTEWLTASLPEIGSWLLRRSSSSARPSIGSRSAPRRCAM